MGNVIVALLLGGFLFNGQAADQSELIELTNEEGKKVKALVPSLNKVKTVASFQFENLTGDAAQDWWGVAFSHLLQLNLDQRPEFYAVSEYALNGYYDRLGISAFTVPSVAMQREIAQKSRNDYFTRISYTLKDNQFEFIGKLYSAQDGKPILDIQVIEKDPYAGIDKIKQEIFDNIPNPLKDSENQVNLPASTLITSKPEALQYFTQSRIAYYKNPTGLEEVVRLAKKAVELDPTSAVCLFWVGDPLYGLGQREEAIEYVKKSIKYGASLPDRMQFGPKSVLYVITNKRDANVKLQEMHRRMFPYDFMPYQTLIPIYKANYGVDSAKSLVHEAIDNGNLERGLLALYDLQLENEEYDEAEKTLDRISQEFPGRDEDRSKYATIYEKQGRIKEAKEILLEEEALDPFNARIQTNLAYLDFKNLDIVQANERVVEGLEQASTLSDSLNLLWTQVFFLRMTGQINKAFKAYAEFETHIIKRSPVNRVVMSYFPTKADMYQSIGQSEKITGLLSELSKYSPESEGTYRCLANTNALEHGYDLEMSKEEYAACRKSYQTYGDGYGEYFDVMNSYLSGDYTKCVEILEADQGRVKKLITSTFFLANIYAKAGDSEKAQELIKRAVDQKTNNPLHYYQMAALLEKEDQQASKKYLDIALSYWADADADYIPALLAKELAGRLAL